MTLQEVHSALGRILQEHPELADLQLEFEGSEWTLELDGNISLIEIIDWNRSRASVQGTRILRWNRAYESSAEKVLADYKLIP